MFSLQKHLKKKELVRCLQVFDFIGKEEDRGVEPRKRKTC
jgi:hypothetical protein